MAATALLQLMTIDQHNLRIAWSKARVVRARPWLARSRLRAPRCLREVRHGAVVAAGLFGLSLHVPGGKQSPNFALKRSAFTFDQPG